MAKFAVIEPHDWDSTKDPVPYYGSGDDIDSLCIGIPGPGKVIPRSKLSVNTVKELEPCNPPGGPRHMTICDWAE